MIILKRDILIFPKFNNIELIQNIREKYDRLYMLVPPHITLVFPFTDDISNEDLYIKLKELIKDTKKFNVKFKGLSLSDDNFIFLNCVLGSKNIIDLHDKIYNNILPTHLKKNIKYIPHITLGKSNNIENLKDFDYEFETIIDEISLEEIGKNEESIIINTIQLK